MQRPAGVRAGDLGAAEAELLGDVGARRGAVHGQPLLGLAAQQRVHRLAAQVAEQVPQRQVDRRDRLQRQPLAPVVGGGAPHLVPHELEIAGVLALDEAAEVVLDDVAARLAGGGDADAARAVARTARDQLRRAVGGKREREHHRRRRRDAAPGVHPTAQRDAGGRAAAAVAGRRLGRLCHRRRLRTKKKSSRRSSTPAKSQVRSMSKKKHPLLHLLTLLIVPQRLTLLIVKQNCPTIPTLTLLRRPHSQRPSWSARRPPWRAANDVPRERGGGGARPGGRAPGCVSARRPSADASRCGCFNGAVSLPTAVMGRGAA